MDEQKRLILAVVLSIIVLVVYQWFFVKPPPPSPSDQAPRQVRDQSLVTASDKERKTAAAHQPGKSAFAPGQTPVPKREDCRTITVDTPLYGISISEFRAAVTGMELKAYRETSDADSPFKQLVPEGLSAGTLQSDLENRSVPGIKDAVYLADTKETDTRLESGEKSIVFRFAADNGVVIKKIYTFRADTYVIDCDIVIQNGSDAAFSDSLMMTASGLFNETVKKRSKFAFEGPISLIDDEYVAIKPGKIEDKNVYNGDIGWSGFTQRYFMTVVMPDRTRSGAPSDARVKLDHTDDMVSVSYVRKTGLLEPGEQARYAYTVYMGPKSLQILSGLDSSLGKAINFGFFHILAKPLLMGMNYIHSVIPNYGVAIILLTVLIKLVFWPLGTKSYKSMNDMKKVQPLMMELREKYKNDRQKMNQEVMNLYKTYKVNPASGCLPMVVQMPIFFALYRMLYLAIELRHAPFFGWITDLSAPDRLFHFNYTIPMMQEPFGLPVLTLIMGASFFVQQKLTPTTGDPTQARMMMLMPIFMTVLFINFPSGLVLYMLANNIISMGQQYYIQRKFS